MRAMTICLGIAVVIIVFMGGILLSDYLPWNKEQIEEVEEIEEVESEEAEFFLDGVKISREDLERRVAQEYVGPSPFYRTHGKILTGQDLETLDANLVSIIFNQILELHRDVYLADLENLSEREILEFVTIRKGTYRINGYLDDYGRARRGAGWARYDEIALSLHGEAVLLLRCLNPVKITNPPAAKKVVVEEKVVYVPTYVLTPTFPTYNGGGNGGNGGNGGGPEGPENCGPGSPSDVN
jgi:hypothetical protein